MSKKGSITVKLHETDCSASKRQAKSVKLKVEDAEVVIEAGEGPSKGYLMPVGDRVIVEILGDNDAVGYFELPMKKLYEFPEQKHLITVNCPTKDPH